jgi:hypothetical protein
MRRETAQTGPGMDGYLLEIIVIDPYQPGIVSDPQLSTQVFRWYRVVGPVDLDMAVPVDPSAAFVEHGEGIEWQSLECRLLDFKKDLPYLALGGPMDPGIRYRGLPAKEVAIELGETSKYPALDGVILHILDAALSTTI